MLVFRARPRRDPVVSPDLTNSERRVMRILGDAMREVRDQVEADEGKLLDAILHQSADRVASMVTVDPWLEAQEKIQDELLSELRSAGQRVKLPTLQKATISFRFNSQRPEAARWAETNAGQLIVEVMQDQMKVVKDYVSRASTGEFTPQQVARGVRDTIGLTNQQAGWVENFRQRQISELMGAGRTFDQAVADSARATQRYHDRIHRYRTETIARTEVLKASNEGRKEAWQQGVEEGFIGADWVKRWSTEFDARTCDRCAPLNGETVPVLDNFPWGDPPLHPNCRCTLLLDEPEEDDNLANLSDEELESAINDLLSETPAADIGIDEQIAQLEAMREPIRQQLVAADFGQIQLPPEEYQRLLAAHKPIFDDLMRLKEQKLQSQRAPSVSPTREGQDIYEQIAQARDYTDTQKASFQDWQGDGYRRVQGSLYGNKGLRGIDPEVRAVIDDLDDAMDSLDTGTVLYRGQTRGLDSLQVGDEISTGSYVSTSTDPVTAGAFSKSAGQVAGELREGETVTIMRIIPGRAKGAVVPNSSEYEVLIARNSSMRVTGITQEEIQGVIFRIVEVQG